MDSCKTLHGPPFPFDGRMRCRIQKVYTHTHIQIYIQVLVTSFAHNGRFCTLTRHSYDDLQMDGLMSRRIRAYTIPSGTDSACDVDVSSRYDIY